MAAAESACALYSIDPTKGTAPTLVSSVSDPISKPADWKLGSRNWWHELVVWCSWYD